MNKAAPWMSRSAGPNAHDAARRAARREGKSLGEWLRDTIVDQAEDFDGSEDDGTRHGRVSNVAARLDRSGASQAGLSRRAPAGSQFGPSHIGPSQFGPNHVGPSHFAQAMPRRGAREVRDDEYVRERRPPAAESSRRWREPVSPEHTDAFLDEAIDSIERRASHREGRADAVLASFATIMEISEARRREEQQAVGSLSQKLADLESKLAARGTVADQNPIKGALARLEARLDMLGSRESTRGTASARTPSFGHADDGADPIRRLEDKLNSILDVVGVRSPQPSIADTSSIALGAARNAATAPARRSLADAIGEIARRQRVLDEPALANRNHRASGDVAPRSAAARRQPAAGDTRLLEQLVRELGTKIEAAHAPSADEHALEALQTQVQRLSQRFELSEQGLSSLPTLAASVRDLFDQLEATRESVEASATHAAREVLRIAANGGRSQEAVSASHDFEVLQDMQDDTDHRTKSTLDAVHDMLATVVDRLATVEGDLNEMRGDPHRPAMQPAARATAEAGVSNLAFASMDMPRDPIVPAKPGRRSAASVEDGQHADFIAAARRAAKSARAEPSLAALQRPPGKTPSEKEARAGLLAKSRDYVETHKRPVLMGIAAILMVLGTITILQRMDMGPSRSFARDDVQTGAKIAQLASPATSKPPARNVAGIEARDLSPSELPKAAAPLADSIPGSDPIQTGSLPKLPAFAAQGRLSATPQALPAGLKAAAAAGNSAAEYDLGVHYADGIAVPRDLKVAAQWFAKAADQGLAPAKYRLASMYEKGLGVSQDKGRAKTLYTQAADAGNPRAMHNLAVLLADGDGHPDYGSAAIWFRKAAGYGIHDSQYNLAILLARGLGVQQSLVQSYQWFAIAAAQNDADATQKRNEVGAKLSPNDLAVAKALAAAFQPKSAAPEANEIEPPSTGWDGVVGASHLNSAKSKVSSL